MESSLREVNRLTNGHGWLYVTVSLVEVQGKTLGTFLMDEFLIRKHE